MAAKKPDAFSDDQFSGVVGAMASIALDDSLPAKERTDAAHCYAQMVGDRHWRSTQQTAPAAEPVDVMAIASRVSEMVREDLAEFMEDLRPEPEAQVRK